jgi:hypothetical protein
LPDSLIVLNCLTFIWLAGWAVRALVDITSGRIRAVSVVLLVFFVFYGVPILLDFTSGIPEYHETPGFSVGAMSVPVTVIYDLFVAACPLFWWLTARPERRNGQRVVLRAGKKAQRLLWLLVFSPLIALAFAPQPSVYLSYGVAVGDTLAPAAADFNPVIGGLAVISLMSAAGILLVHRNFGRVFWLLLPFVTAAMWLQGKRSVVALCFVLVWAVAWIRGYLTKSRVVTLGAVSLIVFGSYVSWYQQRLRPLAVADAYTTYENSRIDYGRDQNLKAAIYCELSDGGVSILDYPGQTIVFYLTMYLPRSVWPGKPFPYATYLTAYALRIRPVLMSWGLTTSVLDEAVANFGWAGLLIGPLTFTLLCRICDHSKDPVVKVVGMIVACLSMTVELVAFAPMAIAWILYLAWSRYALRSAPRTRDSSSTVPVAVRT